VTLDPLVRRVKLPDQRQLLVSDTVGFIERLPHQIVAAFRATLEEAAEADLLLHVIDAAVPEHDRHAETVRGVLGEIGASRVPVIDVFNKADLLTEPERQRLRAVHPTGFCISALHGEGRTELLDAVASRLALDTERVSLHFRLDDGGRDALAQVYRHGRVLRHLTTEGGVSIEVDLPRRILPRFAPFQQRIPAR
jgi:GTP-binding protein HflX